jgi:hypothetical protein
MPRKKKNLRYDNVDLRVLKDLVRFGWMTIDQLAGRYFLPPQPCPARIDGLVSQRLLVRSEEFRVKPIYFATSRGARLAGVGLRAVAQIDENDVYHDLTVVDVADYLIANEPGTHWQTERELRSLAARRRRKSRGSTGGHYPDGMLIDSCGRRIAIEVELSRKSPERYSKILHWYAEQPDIDGLRWYIAPASTMILLPRLMRDHGFTIGDGMTVHCLPPGVGQHR